MIVLVLCCGILFSRHRGEFLVDQLSLSLTYSHSMVVFFFWSPERAIVIGIFCGGSSLSTVEIANSTIIV